MSSSQSRTVFAILAAISFSHLLNDLVQSLLPAIYPMLKAQFALDFWQIGLITLTNQLTASLLQPLVGLYTDRRPQPYLLAGGMAVTLAGLLLLAVAGRYSMLLVSAGLVGVGSSVFHPESSRIARVASGGRYGLAQSLFQTGGNAGSSLGPLLAAFVVVPHGQTSVAWFSIAAVLGIALLWRVGAWYARVGPKHARTTSTYHVPQLSPAKVKLGIFVLLTLVFSKFIYMASLGNYYTFFLIHRFGVSVQSAQIHLFAFLAAVAAGTFIGGPVGDRFGRKYVIWISILGVLPFTLALPYAQSVLDDDPERADRRDPCVGVFGDSGLRAGTASRTGRSGLGTVLRSRLRHRRDWVRPCWARSPIGRASISCTTCARGCPHSAC